MSIGGPKPKESKKHLRFLGLAHCAACLAGAAKPLRWVASQAWAQAAAGAVAVSAKEIVRHAIAAGVCVFMPGMPAAVLAGAAVLASGKVPLTQHALVGKAASRGVGGSGMKAVSLLAVPLAQLSRPFSLYGAMWLVMPHLTPGVWRGICYWQRSMPVLCAYLRTARRARRLRPQDAEALWQEQHEKGAQQVFEMLADLQGFYMKLGQILATKTDMLPPVYTSALSALFDRLPAEPYRRVVATVERELRAPLHMLITQLDPLPLASATIAQVHRGTVTCPLPGVGPKGAVAVKVQHRGVHRMMRADLANMVLGVNLLDALGIELGFDLGSVVREYNVYVPLECDFRREAACMQATSQALATYAKEGMQLLYKVVIPQVVPALTTRQVLTMEYLDGVPLLDAAGLDGDLKHTLMSALVLSFGVQILLQGCFHTDPHPGNLMALTRNGEVCVGLLDFGQVKELSHEERVRAAQLVLALASRDGARLRAAMRSLGVRIENCDQDFEAAPHVMHAGYILFDTRMDMREALESPMDPQANEGWRTTRVPKLPRDLFMIMRVITLLRGVMASWKVYTVSSALLWKPLAMQVLHNCYAEGAQNSMATIQQ